MHESPTVRSLFPLLPGRAYYSVQVPEFTLLTATAVIHSLYLASHHWPLCPLDCVRLAEMLKDKTEHELH